MKAKRHDLHVDNELHPEGNIDMKMRYRGKLERAESSRKVSSGAPDAEVAERLGRDRAMSAPTLIEREKERDARRTREHEVNQLRKLGWMILFFTGFLFVTSLYSLLFSKLLPSSTNVIFRAMQEDNYYCYLIPLTPFVSVIAIYLNWVSMKFFRHN